MLEAHRLPEPGQTLQTPVVQGSLAQRDLAEERLPLQDLPARNPVPIPNAPPAGLPRAAPPCGRYMHDGHFDPRLVDEGARHVRYVNVLTRNLGIDDCNKVTNLQRLKLIVP